MNIRKLIKGSLIALTVAAVAGFSVGQVSAAQIDYNNPNNQPIRTPRFNPYTNVPGGIGNEADFVQLRNSNGDPTVPATVNNFIDPVSAICKVGDKFDIRTYVHNGANTEFNNNGTGSAVARNVSVAMQAPLNKTSKQFVFESSISANNATTVTDKGTLNCQNEVQLKLVPKTVRVYSQAYGWKTGSDSAVNGSMKIGSRTVGSGDVWGCWEDRVIVVYVVEVVAKPKPPTPVFVCDSLVKIFVSDNKYRFTANATGRNGATIKEYRFSFAGSNNYSVALPATTNNVVEHTFPGPGSYTATVTVDFDVNGTVRPATSDDCKVKVEIPKDDKCPVPGKEDLSKNDPKCREEKPTILPETGAGALAGIFAATSMAGTVAHRLVYRRRQ